MEVGCSSSASNASSARLSLLGRWDMKASPAVRALALAGTADSEAVGLVWAAAEAVADSAAPEAWHTPAAQSRTAQPVSR